MRSTILVEGDDDQSVIYHLLRPRDFELREQTKILRHPLFGEVDIKNAKGADKVLTDIGPLLKSEAPAVGVILDRDVDVPGQSHPWPSIRSRVLKVIPDLEFRLPKEQDSLPSDGLNVRFGRNRRFGLWLMPDNQSLGMLETFVAALIPSGDGLWPLAQAAVARIPDHDRRFAHKAHIHTWLAW